MTDDQRLQVRGGVGGTTVGLDELVAAAGQLGEAASLLGEVVVRLVAATAEVGVSAALSPVTAAHAESELGVAVQAVALEAAALAGVATAVRSTAGAYRVVEDEVVRSAATAQDVVMFAVGHGAPTLVVGVVVLDARGVDVGELLDRTAWQVPELADLAGGSGGLLVGLRSNPLTSPFVGPPHLAGNSRTGGTRGGARAADPDQSAVGVLADSAALWGLLSDDGSVQVTPLDHGVVGRAPSGVADLARHQAAIPGGGVVRVVQVQGQQGSAWIVEIPGTQEWDPHAGANPLDVTTDVRSMAAQGTLLAAGVERALAEAQASAAAETPGRDVGAEPVLLSGHSLGGIVAAGLASSTEFRAAHRVTHVVTTGSPIGKVPVPEGVQVLALEHRQDAVPRLEGRPNPDRAGWVTVSRDLDDEHGTDERASAAHRSERYVTTAAAVDAMDNPSVATWRAGADRFFGDPADPSTAVVRDYRIARVAAPP